MMTPLLLVATLVSGQVETPGRITVLLPSQARLYIDGQLCPLTSDTRSFDTPALEPGRSYYYTLKATLQRDGRTVEMSKKVTVRAGKRAVVDFGDLTPNDTASSPGPDASPSPAGSHVIPRGSPPSLMVARMEGDSLEISRSVMEWQTRQRTRIVKTRDGDRQETYTMSVAVFRWVTERVDPQKLQVLDGDGRAVPAARLSKLLARDTAVLVSDKGQKVSAPYRDVFRKATLVLVRPMQPSAPPAPPERKDGDAASSAPKEKPAAVQGPAPQLCLVRLDGAGILHLRQCEETPYFETAYREISTEEGVRKVPYTTQSTLLRVMMREVPLRQFKVHESDGEEADASELPRRLQREKVVLVAFDGKQVPSFYLRQVKKGTLILVPSEESQRIFLNPFGFSYAAPPGMPGGPVPAVPAPGSRPSPVRPGAVQPR
jgi:uncharacterized protein (TIGR03000 family)